MLELNGAAWSVEALDGDGVLIGGGDSDESCYWYECYTIFSSFASLLNEDGALDAAFARAGNRKVEALDVTRQPDGKVVAVGRRRKAGARARISSCSGSGQTARSTRASLAGILDLRWQVLAESHRGTAIALEPDGRDRGRRCTRNRVVSSVIPRAHERNLLVLRLLADGSLDPGFGTAGAYVGPAVELLLPTFGLHAPPPATIASRRRRIGLPDHRRHGGRRTRCVVCGLGHCAGRDPLQAHRSPAGRSRPRLTAACSSRAVRRPGLPRCSRDGALDPAFASDAASRNPWTMQPQLRREPAARSSSPDQG